MTFVAQLRGLATKVLESRRGSSERPGVRLPTLLPALLLAACVSRPQAPSARIASVPAGATCTTEEGEVYTLPARVPCEADGVTHVELSLPGHATRRVGLIQGGGRPRLASLLLADLVGGLVGGSPERVQVIEGKAVLELEPLDGAGEGPVPAR